jgi:DNA-damage-inducible protein J
LRQNLTRVAALDSDPGYWYNVYTIAVQIHRRYFTVPKTAVISARIDPELKHGAEDVFKELGLTATEAITLFYKMVELERGLPFAVRVPNEVTVEALEQARTRQGLKEYNTLDDLFQDLGI